MKQPKEILIEWLRDAHAMESNLIQMLDQQIGHLEDHPQLEERLVSHKEESRRHASRLEECLARLGADTSSLKEGIAKVSGMISPLPAAMSSDTPVKVVLANYASEHFEIASYRSLEAAARHCGEEEIARVASEILREEESMAEFLAGCIEPTTRTHLGMTESAAAGSR